MALLLYHWHCIIPVAAILIGLWLMGRDKPDGENKHADSQNTGTRRTE